MPTLLRHEHVFVVRHQIDLPDLWQGPGAGFLAECSIKLGRPLEHLKAEVVFELPECHLSREYQRFLDLQGRRADTAIGVAITNVDDFAAAHGKGAIKDALHNLQNHGYPCHYMRICIARIQPQHNGSSESRGGV